MQLYNPIALLGKNWLTVRSGLTTVFIAEVHLLILPYTMINLKEFSGNTIITRRPAQHPQITDGCQCANLHVHL